MTFAQGLVRRSKKSQVARRRRSRLERLVRGRRMFAEPLEDRRLLAVFTVTSLGDGAPTGANDTLREMIQLANDSPGPDTIEFDSGLTGEITLTEGQLRITESLTISGPGVNDLTIDAGGNSRIFLIADASPGINEIDPNVTIEDVTLTGGDSSSQTASDTPETGSGGQPATRGGTIFAYSNGQIQLDDVVITGSSSPDDGGAILHFGTGDLVLNRSRISGSSSSDNGGAIYSRGASTILSPHQGLVQVNDSTIENNAASDKGGGVMTVFSTLNVVRSTISGNSTTVDSGNVPFPQGNSGGAGLYTFAGKITVDSSTISGNQSARHGGGIKAHSNLSSITVINSTISGNSAIDGGGIYSFDSGVQVHNSTITNNTASGVGGGAALSRGDFQYTPGSTSSIYADARQISIENTIIAGNSASGSHPDFAPPATHEGGSVTIHSSLIGNAKQTQPSFTHSITLQDETVNVNFTGFSNRGPHFALLRQGSDGVIRPVDAPPVSTYIGTVEGRPGAIASGIRRADGTILARVMFEDGEEWIDDGTNVTRRTDTFTPRLPTFVVREGGAGSQVFAAQVGIDLASDQVVASGGTAASALEMAEFSMMSMNAIYMRDTAILNQIERVIVRSDATQDPYTPPDSTDAPGTYLATVKDQWENVLPSGNHDLATVITSNLGGNGLANVGVVGGPGYSWNGALSNGDFTVVGRHELGHNWNQVHYDGAPGDTDAEREPFRPEGPTINSGNTLSRFSGPEVEKTLRHRTDHANFLDIIGTPTFPIPPRASNDVVTVAGGVTSAVIDVLANDHDVNGTAISILSFDDMTRNGLTVSRDGQQLTVDIPAGTTVTDDDFTYRIQDADGMTSRAVVHLTSQTLDPVAATPAALGPAPTDLNGNRIGSSSSPVDPLLGPLMDNGGPTSTHALLNGSPAIDGGDQDTVAGQNGVPEFDQRVTGFVRISGDRIDIGSFESGVAVANIAPVLDAIGAQTATVDTALTFTAMATDPDSGDTLTFSLAAGAPAGASIDPSSGVFSFTPTAAGNETVTVVVTDDGTPNESDSETITITVEREAVTGPNEAPVISEISSQLINRDTSTRELAFTISDDQDIAALQLAAPTSSNVILVPNSGIQLSGSGANRTLIVTPAAGEVGTSTITLSVTDGEGAVGTESFVITVSPTTGLSFNFTYEDDGTGQGFDDPGLGEARKEALEDAAATLGSWFAAHGDH